MKLSVAEMEKFKQAVCDALPYDIDPTVAMAWRANPRALQKVLRQALVPAVPTDRGSKDKRR